jgi:hypothetical protein
MRPIGNRRVANGQERTIFEVSTSCIEPSEHHAH